MGKLITLKCNKCGYENNLGIGTGMLFFDFEKVIELFETETQEKIRKAADPTGERSWEVYKEIGICANCKKISAIAVFKTTDEAGNYIRYQSKCECGGEAVLVDSGEILSGKRTVECPQCKAALEATINGTWD